MRTAPQVRARSLLPLYGSGVVLGSILAHLASEFASMGADAEPLALSPRHFYLGALAALCAGVICFTIVRIWRAAADARDLRRIIREGIEALPFRGRGRFFAVTGLLQLAIGMLTELGEGCPFCAHDIATGLIGALITVVALAAACRAIGRRLPRIAAAIAELLLAPSRESAASPYAAPRLTALFCSLSLPTQLFNRPPPARLV